MWVGLRENLWHDDLSQVELRAPLFVSPETTVEATIETMRAASAGCVLIREGESLRGIFTERDVVKRILAPRADIRKPISQFMTANPVTARRSDPIGSVIRTMHEGHYRHLPVTDDDGVPIGTVSVKRIVQYLVDYFPEAVYNLPPQPGQVHETREGP